MILAILFCTTGCVNADADATSISPTTENTNMQDCENVVTEHANPEDNANNVTEQNVIPSADTNDRLDNYMVSVKEQSDSIKTFLEYDAVTQNEMNMKSLELYELWDEALNYIWGELKISLSEEEFAKLLDEQLVWIAEKENASKEAGKEFEGGSLYPLIVNGRAAALTEERVYELYEILKETAI